MHRAKCKREQHKQMESHPARGHEKSSHQLKRNFQARFRQGLDKNALGPETIGSL